MGMYEEGLALLREKLGNGRDNILALATVERTPGADGKPRPAVRCVDACYEDGVFYAVTYRTSHKMAQIAENPAVSVALSAEMFTASGVGEDLGWVLDPKNAELRARLRAAFAAWYDLANNEADENCRILAIRLTRGILNVNHWEKLYHLDFARGVCAEDGKQG